jgi:[ribosomal protein S18]-alanine N-acetyltransferase
VTVHLSLGSIEEIESIIPVMNCAFAPDYGEAWSAAQCVSMLALPGSFFVIGWASERVAGFAIARTVLDETELLLIAVDPEHHGQGLGTQLLDYVATESAALGSTKMHVEVRSDNVARHFYRARGFDEVGVRPNYYRRKDGGPTQAISLSRFNTVVTFS